MGKKSWSKTLKRKSGGLTEEEEKEARAVAEEAEMLLRMDSCPCGGANNKNFLKKNKETVGNTFLIKNHIYRNLY